MTEAISTLINEQWTVILPEHRADRGGLWVTWERPRLESMHAHIRPGDLVFDIGAEEGDLSALYASWGARVVLVEPNLRVWPNIRFCFEHNEFTPAGWFVGFASEEPRGEPVDNPGGWPGCAYGKVIGDHGFLHLHERPDVPATTIDQMAEVFGPPAVITVDVEGAEKHVMLGATKTLEEHRPFVWISVHPEFMFANYGEYEGELHTVLHSRGYAKHHLAFDHEHHVFYFPEERRDSVQLPCPLYGYDHYTGVDLLHDSGPGSSAEESTPEP